MGAWAWSCESAIDGCTRGVRVSVLGPCLTPGPRIRSSVGACTVGSHALGTGGCTGGCTGGSHALGTAPAARPGPTVTPDCPSICTLGPHAFDQGRHHDIRPPPSSTVTGPHGYRPPHPLAFLAPTPRSQGPSSSMVTGPHGNRPPRLQATPSSCIPGPHATVTGPLILYGYRPPWKQAPTGTGHPHPPRLQAPPSSCVPGPHASYQVRHQSLGVFLGWAPASGAQHMPCVGRGGSEA